MAIPGQITFSPDDTLVTYLYSPEHDLSLKLYAFDPRTRERNLLLTPPDGGDTDENVSREEALRRERMRQLTTGVTQYAWADRACRMLIPLQGSIYVKDGPDAPLRSLVESERDPILDPQLSPDGDWVAYVQDAEIFVVPFTGGEPRQITAGAQDDGLSHGLAEFVAQEEMDRRHGFWWSPDSRSIAFTEVDERHIPVYPIVHQGQATLDAGAIEEHRYPFAGAENARVRLGVVAATGGEPVWMDLGNCDDIYLARVAWMPDGRLTAQTENRMQTSLELRRFDPDTGQAQVILRETSDVWINLSDLFRPLREPRADGGHFVWGSERTGFQHLYLYDADGLLIRALTQGDWMVESIVGIDEAASVIYFIGTRESPLESHLYAVSLDGGELRRITAEPGMHSVVLDRRFERFVDTYHAIDHPPIVTLRSLADGAELAVIHDEIDPRVSELPLRPPELVALTNRDGVTLYGAIFHPPEGVGQRPYPTIVSVYGGPHAQRVAQSWRTTIDMRAQYLSSRGYLVFVLDNCGSARRGLAFEGAIRHRLGHVEVEDQVAGVRWLVAHGLADPNRVGIYGWSYGGYMAAMCMARAPEVFSVAVAGAPVTAWDGYDTHYTERYMGLPQSNATGYASSSVLGHADQIVGRLLLVHGLIDENVHFRHTARLVNALTAARKPYDLLLFPDERHSPRRLADRVFMEERILDYFERHL
ncbi:MAG: S9 family peptidase [Chloroflexi bacterium]|nr:S9 family peptidase [Chloroflexota bacterium]